MLVNRVVGGILATVLLMMARPVSHAARMAVTADEITTWTRYTVPLPKSIQILGKVQVDCDRVAIVLPASSDIKVPQARKELRQALGLPETGDDPSNPAFTITLQLGGSESSGLSALANSDQAYKILPEAGDTGLRLVALQPAGLYYAAKTLVQMLPWRVSGGSVQIPIVQVLDWPDIADRGLWGCDHFLWLKWMGDRKMNIGEQISAREVRSDLRGYSYLKPGRETMVTEGPFYGVKPVPVTLHLEQVYSTGLFTYYPQVIGVGGQYGCICYSNGAFTHVLADWLVDLASLPYVDGVDVWMAENLHGLGGCHCAQCSLWNRNVLEANTIVVAWNEAKARLGRYVNLWILTSEETYSSNTQVFAAVPSDVRIWYYHSLYTYITGRNEMIPSNVENVANSGRYAGVCPLISSTGRQPFSSAEFIKYRMNEFASKKLSGVLGYAVPPPLVKFVGYNVEAEAEWSWNSAGRSAHEFAASYAVRKGYPDPETFANWADAIGKLELDLYGSDWPTGEGRHYPGYVAELLQNGTLPPLGTTYPGFRGPWGEFHSAQQFDDDVVLACKALALAKKMGIEEYYRESLYVDGLIKALRALYKLKSLVVGGTVSQQNRETARYHFGVYINSLKQSIDAVRDWCVAVNGESDTVQSTVDTLNHCIYGESGTTNPGMLQVASACGCTPTMPYKGATAVTIADAKRLGAGAMVSLYGDVVTGGFGSTCFLECPDRSCAIRMLSPGSAPASAPAAVFGTVASANGELLVNAELIQSVGPTEPVAPVLMPLGSLGGGAFGEQPAVMEYRSGGTAVPAVGLNNLGLLVRVAGTVTFVGSDYFYIDDGSRCNDGSGHTGVRVVCADAAWQKPAVGDFVTVQGMSSTYFERGQTWRALYVPSSANIATVPVSVEIIIDEDQAAFTGDWTYATGGGAYNDDYKYAATSTVENATARWTPNITRPGNYDVYVMYSQDAGHTTHAAYTISCFDGQHTYTVNQRSGGGTWHLLGRHLFAAGGAGYVQLGNASADGGTTVVADAVRFVRASSGTPPSITSQPSDQSVCSGSNVSFSIAAEGSSPLYYRWRKGTTDIIDGGRFSGATTNRLQIANCAPSDTAQDYNCVVTNAYGSVVSENACLLVGDAQAVPTALPASSIGMESITWNWTAVLGATGYRLWTAASGGTQIGGTITGTSYTESGLEPGTSYIRYVEALSACGASVTRTQLGPASTAPRYCVQNGDFEDGFTGGVGNHWIKAAGSGTFAQETTIKRDGTSSQRFYDAVGGDAFTAWIYQKISVQPGRKYTYKVYNRREVASGCVVMLGISTTGGLTPDLTWQTMGSGAGVWSLKSGSFTAGQTGVVTVMLCAGSNNKDTTAYVDGVYLLPQAPTTSAGSTTISPGQSTTITASGGFGGDNSELHWYTGPAGTGTHAGTGTSLLVSPSVTTTYYPRWEPTPGCPSDDGPSVTVQVN